MAGLTSKGSRQENVLASGYLARWATSLRHWWTWTRGRERDEILWYLSLAAAVSLAASLVVDATWADLYPNALPVIALTTVYGTLLCAIPCAAPRVALWLRHVLILGMLALLFVRGATPGEWPFLYLVGVAVAGLAAVLVPPWMVLLYTLAADAIILWRTWPAGPGALNLGTVAVTGLGATVAAFIFARAESLALQRGEALRQAALLERERAAALEQSKATLEARVAERTEQLRNFIATVSHDLRAPLTNIRAYAEAELQGDAVLPSELRRSLEIILDETGVLAEHVNTLLFAAQIDAEALQPHLEALAADELVADVVARVRGRFLLAQRIARVDVPPDLPPVRADRRFARMIIGNLMDNAHKYSPPGAPIEIGGAHAGGYVCIGVRDYGPGIPAAEREQLFERFRRGSGRVGGTGLGLGLWICRELAHSLDGEVDAVDAPGGGCVFTLRLPVYGELPG